MLYAVCVILLALFFLPTIFAFSRAHPSAPAILALNLLLGFTFIGWVVALVWSLSNPQRFPIIVLQQPAPRVDA